ncbi:hypothetical protein [Streptomyces sp. NPDC056600]|uniref:hypothetical protein n=1 Tax=Streptomyces sp. NPDC056600 TaxID=3345874 RepID=UPI00369476A4
MVSERADGASGAGVAAGTGGAGEAGALLLCRAAPRVVAPVARLLRERMLLGGAGTGWSVLVPERTPWTGTGTEDRVSAGRVVGGWTSALAVAATWPVLGMWWDAEGSGFVLASGFRRAVGLAWREDGAVVGAEAATGGWWVGGDGAAGVGGGGAGDGGAGSGDGFAADGADAGGGGAWAGEGEALVLALVGRLGLDPVLDAELLEGLRTPDPEADAGARLRGLLAVLTRTGVALPAGVEPGSSAGALCEALRGHAGTRRVEWPGWREAVLGELDVAVGGRLGAWMPWSGGWRAMGLAVGQVGVGVPTVVTGVRRGRAGVVGVGAVLVAQGVVGVAYGALRRARA